MFFCPYVIQTETGKHVETTLTSATASDLKLTQEKPEWQTNWTSEYLSKPTVDTFALKTCYNELIALAAYQIRGKSAYVFILYAESAPHSNPTIHPREERKYYGIGELLIAFGIKYSIDHGCRGDVVFEAKTDALARHYEQDFHATRIPSERMDGPKRYMLVDEDAWRLFSKYLKENAE